MRAGRDADGPGCADLVIYCAQNQVAIEYLNSPVAPVGHIDIALGVGGDRVRRVELIRLISARSNRFDESTILVVLDYPRVAIAIGDVDISGSVPGNISWPVENVRPRVWRWRAWWRRCLQAVRFRPSAKQHQHFAFGVELDHHVRALVNGPDVVLRIDPNHMSEGEAVQTVADEAEKLAGLIEF